MPTRSTFGAVMLTLCIRALRVAKPVARILSTPMLTRGRRRHLTSVYI